MTTRQAERITKLDIKCLSAKPRCYHFAGFEVPPVTRIPIAEGYGKTADEALTKLVAANYERVRLIVFERDKWRCSVCGRIKPLQFDHVIPRSKGRVDVASNGRALCFECHRKRHG